MERLFPIYPTKDAGVLSIALLTALNVGLILAYAFGATIGVLLAFRALG